MATTVPAVPGNPGPIPVRAGTTAINCITRRSGRSSAARRGTGHLPSVIATCEPDILWCGATTYARVMPIRRADMRVAGIIWTAIARTAFTAERQRPPGRCTDPLATATTRQLRATVVIGDGTRQAPIARTWAAENRYTAENTRGIRAARRSGDQAHGMATRATLINGGPCHTHVAAIHGDRCTAVQRTPQPRTVGITATPRTAGIDRDRHLSPREAKALPGRRLGINQPTRTGPNHLPATPLGNRPGARPPAVDAFRTQATASATRSYR